MFGDNEKLTVVRRFKKAGLVYLMCCISRRCVFRDASGQTVGIDEAARRIDAAYPRRG